jgi:hypothetical protein
VKILAPSAVIAELIDGFLVLAWSEAGLITQSVKNKLCVQPSAQSGWSHYLSSTPRSSSIELPLHDILDGSELYDPLDPLNWRNWPLHDGVNIMGTLVRSPGFEKDYLSGKG